MIKIRSEFWRRRRYDQYSYRSTTNRKRKLFELLALLAGLGVIHVIAMRVFEGLSWEDAAWLTMTTMTTVGYGDMSAGSPLGRLSTVLMMYMFGIFLLAQIAGELIDYRMHQRESMLKGLWSWKMKNHIVIINTPEKDGSRYLQTLVEQIRKSTSLEEYPIQIFSRSFPEGLPNELASLGVVLRQGHPEGRSEMSEVDVEHAAFVIVLSVDVSEYRSDSITLDILDQLKQYDTTAYVIAECVQDENRDRLRAHGADAVLRPVRAYPELMVRAMAAPGTETILEDLFKHEGVHPRRYELQIEAQPWGKLAARIVMRGLGTPLGYVDQSDKIITNPRSDTIVTGHAIFLMVNHDNIPEGKVVEHCVSEKD